MESDIARRIDVTLILNEEEAKWLKGLMQNPIGLTQEEDPETEDTYSKAMRKRFWAGLVDINL